VGNADASVCAVDRKVFIQPMLYDAIVIGAGHNGLVAALVLAKAGWRVLVLERNDAIGGAIRSGEATLPGFVHDLYSTNQNLFLGSAFHAEFGAELAAHGLSFAHSDKPVCCVFPDGSRLPVYRDAEKTYAALAAHDPGDARGFRELEAAFSTFRRSLLPILGAAMPSPALAAILGRALWNEGPGGLAALAKLLLLSTRRLGDAYLHTPEAKALLACWGLHVDYSPDVAGGAVFPLVETFTDMEAGMAVVEGGASKLVEAMASLLRAYGGEVRTGAEVARIVVENGRAVGVELAGGECIRAARAVVANLTPGPLFGRLLAGVPLPQGVAEEASQYAYGPGTMMLHLALCAPPAWRAGGDTNEFAYVHIAPFVEDLSQTYADAADGLLPASPLLVVGQTSAVDPTRAPEGRHVLWVQVRALPSTIRGDAAGAIKARTWDEAKEPFADRVLDKLEAYAPGLRASILGRAVHSPVDLERDNPNLVGGDSAGGSHHLAQNFLFRPLLGWSRYRMPVRGLWMVGAGTWPGAGNNATSGYLAAKALLDGASPLDRVVEALETLVRDLCTLSPLPGRRSAERARPPG
jgi:phytoene dehydrogenase-like protein